MLESLLTQNDFELMTSLQTCKENKNAQLGNLNTILERQSSIITITGLIPKQVT